MRREGPSTQHTITAHILFAFTLLFLLAACLVFPFSLTALLLPPSPMPVPCVCVCVCHRVSSALRQSLLSLQSQQAAELEASNTQYVAQMKTMVNLGSEFYMKAVVSEEKIDTRERCDTHTPMRSRGASHASRGETKLTSYISPSFVSFSLCVCVCVCC